MTVRKRGRFYHYQFIVNGQAYYGKLPTAKDKREALLKEADIRRSVYDGTYGKETGLEVFSIFVDSVFLKYSREHKTSWRHDEFRCQVLKEYFAGKTFKQLTPMLVEKYIKDRLNTETVRKKRRSPVTVHKELALLSSIFNMAVQEQVTNENPCRFVRKGVRKNLQARNKRDR